MRLPLRGPVPYDLVGRVVAVLAERHRAPGAAAEHPGPGSAEQPGSQQDENDPGTSDR